jgi:ribosomal-protein-alanine acetyltransferase
MAWQLRVARPEDLDAIMAIENSTFGTDAWTAETMLADILTPNTCYLVAFEPETPGRIDGYGGILAPHGSGSADIQTIAVLESSRHRGLGRQLMRSLIGEARRRAAREVFLEVRADNPNAQALYESLGFEQIAVRPQYYQPDGVDAHVMKLDVPEPRLSPAVGS